MTMRSNEGTPSRLWCEHDHDPERSEVEAIGYNRPLPYTVEFIRADIARQEADALVAAAMRDAVFACECEFLEDPEPNSDSDVAYDTAIGDCIRGIQSHTPSDARAALEAMLEQAFHRGFRAGLLEGAPGLPVNVPIADQMLRDADRRDGLKEEDDG